MSSRVFRVAVMVGVALTARSVRAAPWVDGYLPGWASGTLPTSEVDYSAMSMVIDFSLVVNADGSLDSSGNGVGAVSAASVAAAHAAGDKIIISVGGAGSGSAFDAAINSNSSGLVANIVAYVKQYGYDGADIDAEPINASTYPKLVGALRAALPSPYILTTTAGDGDQTAIAPVAASLDQINIMTYDMAGDWQGWVSWYNGALYEYGTAATNGAEASASVDSVVTHFIQAGIAASKIGIGSEFGGAVWPGVTAPNQTPGGPVAFDVSYRTIKGYGGTYAWDDKAQASSMLSSKGWATYDDTADVAAKLQYIASKKLGGIILWSLDMDHEKGTTGQDPLLNAIKANWTNDGGAPPPPSDGGATPDAAPDAAPPADAGSEPNEVVSSGCSTSGASEAPWLAVAAALVALGRSRRRRSR